MTDINKTIDCLAFTLASHCQLLDELFFSLIKLNDGVYELNYHFWISWEYKAAAKLGQLCHLSFSSNQFTHFSPSFLFNFRDKQIKKVNVQFGCNTSKTSITKYIWTRCCCVSEHRGLCREQSSLELSFVKIRLLCVKSSLIVQRHGRVGCLVREVLVIYKWKIVLKLVKTWKLSAMRDKWDD